MPRSLPWKVNHFVHNVIAHPLLPLAEHLLEKGDVQLAKLIFKFHDLTTPKDDPYNKQRFL